MKRLGADIKDGGKSLTEDDINYLDPEKAHDISVATRLALGNDSIHKLFKDQLARSDSFWKATEQIYMSSLPCSSNLRMTASCSNRLFIGHRKHPTRWYKGTNSTTLSNLWRISAW